MGVVGLLWHVAEGAIAIGLGIAASSIALIGFGADSFIEAAAAVIVLWRLRRPASDTRVAQTERRASRLIGATFYLLAIYITVEALRTLIAGLEPDASVPGIVLAAVTAIAMPPLARAKARAGQGMGSRAVRSEGRQNLLCAYLSVALLVGLGANALFGFWWADPAAALFIAVAAVKEGRDAWRGEPECCA